MNPEDERGWEREAPYAQIIDFDVVYENGDRKWLGADVNDRLYGDFRFDMAVPGDAAIIELLYSEPVQRLRLIQQLILPPEFATRPETTDFTRLEHSIGCLLLARKLGGTKEQQIRALMHDVAQTAFSHLGDWLHQGMDGADNYHDDMQLEYMRSWGIDKILAKYGFDLDTVFDKSVMDFVERPAPDLCVDRVDYSLREFARWTCPEDVTSFINALIVKDDMIAFDTGDAATSQLLARQFFESYKDLFWKHWAEDEHVVKEILFFKAVQRGIEVGVIDENDMYSVDPAVKVKLEMWGDEVVRELLFLAGRSNLRFGYVKGTYESLSLDTDYHEKDRDHLFFPVRPFHPRSVDPSFIDEGERLALSWIDGDYRTRDLHHREVTEYQFSQDFRNKLGIELLHYVQLEVEPATKEVLAGVGEFK